MFGKLVCWITPKHKRGIKMSREDGQSPASWPLEKAEAAYRAGYDIFMCPRCYSAWKRKATRTAKKEGE